MAPTFEETCKEYPVLGNLINKANPNEREVLKRLFGYSAPSLGTGPTRSQLVMSTLKFVVDELVKKPIRDEKRKETKENSEEDVQIQNEETAKQNGLERKTEEKQPEPDGSDFKTVRRICKHFARNRCKKGSECNFSHPDMCPKFVKFGPYRETNPKGCEGKNCELLHARTKWCIKAVKFNKCMNPSCKYEHFKGTLTKQKPQSERQKKENVRFNRAVTNNFKPSQVNTLSYADAARLPVTDQPGQHQENQSFLGATSLNLQQMMIEVISRMNNLEKQLQYQNSQGKPAWVH